MSIGRTQLSDEYTDIKRYEVFTTEKYKLPLYSFSMVDKNDKKVVIKYYILSQDLSKIIKGYNNNPIKAYTVKQNSCINGGFLDYVLYNNEAYISSTLIAKSKSLVGWNIDMEDLIRDIQNATIAEELNYAEAMRDFSVYEVECKHSMLVNEDKLKFVVKQSYPFLDESYIEGIIRLILDHAVIEFDLPYNKLEFVNDVKMKAVNEAFDFIEEVVRDYRNEFNNNNGMTPKEEIKKTEMAIEQGYCDEMTKAFEEAIQNRINVIDFITHETVHNFKETMFTALIEEINKQRKADNLKELARDHIRTSIHYRSAYIEYGTYYKQIVNDNSYNTDEDWLMSMFFMDHIFSQDAYHDEDRKRAPFLKADNAQVYALLTESRYKGLLKGIVKSVLLKSLYDQYPEYKVSNEDWKKIKDFVRQKLYRPER